MQVTKPKKAANPEQSYEYWFIRGTKKTMLPAGKLGPGKSAQGETEPTPEMIEGTVVTIFNPSTNQEIDVGIDPRHPLARDHLKIVQDVLSGRNGGLTPVALTLDLGVAYTPEGTPIEDSKFLRFGEISNPAPARGENKIIVDGKSIGEWAPELDAAVDRAVDFEIAGSAAKMLNRLESDEAEWTALKDRAAGILKEQWGAKFQDPEQLTQEIERSLPTRDDFMHGRIPVGENGEQHGVVYDPLRQPMPNAETTTQWEQAMWACQRSMIEGFQAEMQNGVIQIHEGGEVIRGSVYTRVEKELVAEGRLPVGNQNRDVTLGDMVIAEKSRAIGTHMMAGLLAARGAEIQDEALMAEVVGENSLAGDIMQTMNANPGLKPEDYPAKFLETAQGRCSDYREQAHGNVATAAQKHLKMPSQSAEQAKDGLDLGKAGTVLNNIGSKATEAGDTLEGIGYGL